MSRSAKETPEHKILPIRERVRRANPVFILLLLHSGAGLQVGI